MPDLRAILVRSSHAGGAVSRARSRFRWPGWLRWQYWLVLFVMGALVIAFEVRDHTHMWQLHNSGQSFWSDSELVREVILFGLVLPIVGGVLIGYLGRTAIERDEMAGELALRRALVRQMHEAQSWHELAELIVTTPGAVVSAERAWLMAQQSSEEEFDLMAQWKRPGSGPSLSCPPVSPAVCENCAEFQSLKGTRIMTCHRSGRDNSAWRCPRYCLSLSSGDAGKAILLFDMTLDRPLGRDQMEVLDDLGDEMSLTIENANLHYVKQRQVDVTRNERLRIARDLHDTLGQNVSYLRLKLEQLSAARLASDSTEFQDDLANMLAVADEAYEQMRDTLEELRTMEHRDLEEAIRQYAAPAAERAGFSVRVHSSGQAGTLSPRQNRQMFYITREALNNVEKHAGARRVDIHLQWHDGEFRLTVSDDGKGFRLEELSTADRYGMTIMGERARAMKADLIVESAPGEGTDLTLRLPLLRGAVDVSRS